MAAGIRVQTLSRYALGDKRQPGLVIGYGRMHEAAIGPAIDALSQVLTPALFDAHGENAGRLA
jgi:hypothetical protein